MESPARLAAALLLVPALLTLSTAAQAAPEERGPRAVTAWEPGLVAVAGVLLPTTVYLPADLEAQPAPLPVVAVVHGAGRTGTYMVEMAETLASHGIIAVVPSIPCLPALCLHGENARQISGILEWAVMQGDEAESPLFGHVDADRRGVVGHSWGGLGSLLATAADPSIDSAVYLDPNDDFGGPGLAAAAEIDRPVAVVRAERLGACNTLWQAETYTHFAGPRLELVVRGAGHCDVEAPTDLLCATLCGPGSADTTPLFRRYAVAFTVCNLTADPAMAPWVGGAELTRDEMSMAVMGVRGDGLAGLPCHAMAPPADAGTPDAAHTADAGGAGVPDARSQAPDAAVAPNADAAAAHGGANGEGGSGGAGRADASASNPTTDAALSTFADAGAGSGADGGAKNGADNHACAVRPGRVASAGSLALGAWFVGIAATSARRSRRRRNP